MVSGDCGSGAVRRKHGFRLPAVLFPVAGAPAGVDMPYIVTYKIRALVFFSLIQLQCQLMPTVPSPRLGWGYVVPHCSGSNEVSVPV